MRRIFIGAFVVSLLCAAMAVAAAAELSVDIQRTDSQVVVTVLSDGNPCGDCDVKVKDGDGTPLIIGRTESDGKFEFDIYGLEHVKVLATGPNGESVEESVENAIGSNRKNYGYEPEAQEHPADAEAQVSDAASDGNEDASALEEKSGGPGLAPFLILMAVLAAALVGWRLFSRSKA